MTDQPSADRPPGEQPSSPDAGAPPPADQASMGAPPPVPPMAPAAQAPMGAPPPPVPPMPSAAWQAPVEQAGPAPGVQFADHGARLMSYILDVVIVTIVLVVFSIVVAALIALTGTSSEGATTAGWSLVIVLLIGVIAITIGYFPWFWMRGGQTPGMRPFELYVVRDADGGPVTGGAAALRLVGYWINGITLYIGFAWILVDKRRRGWHDLIAGTVVIKR